MAIVYGSQNRIERQGSVATQVPPIVRELEGIFAHLDDGPLLDALIGPTRRGPKGHPVEVL